MITTASVKAARCALLSLIAALAVGGCEGVEPDEIMGKGGTAPPPAAVLEGSILYSGPAPKCTTDVVTRQRRVKGNVVLLLYLFENPPFPEGNATGSENLLIVSGDQLFDVEDCLPDGVEPNYDLRIARSVPFRWPGVTLKESKAAYQIRGFYDYDEDLIPTFSVTRMQTAGDIMGAALTDVQKPELGPLKIELPDGREVPNGHVKGGISVALGTPVWTERPVFRLSEHRQLAASSPFTVAVDGTGVPDPVATQQRFRELTCPPGRTGNCGLSLEPLRADEARLRAAGVQLNVDDPDAYAFWVQPIDIKTIDPTGLDQERKPDDQVDPHPVLGSLGVKWYSPILLLSRWLRPEPAALPDAPAREAAAGIPGVRLLGSVVLGGATPSSAKPFGAGAAPMAVPPVALVELIPGRPECRVPYFPPGTPAAVIDGNVAHCGELPTGRYAATVVNGLMGARATGNPPELDRRTMLPSLQSWSIPNELSDRNQTLAYQEFESQGEPGLFLVHSPSERPGACQGTPAGQCGKNSASIDAAGVDTPVCLPDVCCDAVEHLCGLPLCPTVNDASGLKVRGSPTSVERVGDAGVPNCVPFEMPSVCCPTARSQRN